jgi:O-acetyl-ADP-ribose deacetylase (regulator of RNase III)
VVIDVRVDDLAFYEGEAIARPVNAMLGATTPVMRKLERAAGASFVEKARLSEPLPVGAAVVTNAGDLPVELLIHGVVSSDDEPASRATVRLALMSALQRAVAFQIRELVMAEVLTDHMKRSSYPSTVLVIAETELEEQVLRARLKASP